MNYIISIIQRECYKNPKNFSFIDQILINKQERFFTAKATETGLSDFHKNVVLVFKTAFKYWEMEQPGHFIKKS